MSENEIKPVAWRWIDTCTFRKSIPKTATAGDWNPLYDQSTIDHLREELAEIRSQRDRAELLVEARGTCIASVTAERDAAVADAERYRWLRDKCNHIGGGLHIQFSSNASEADAAIDAARAQERQ